jgi:hypothetical protein
VTRENPGVMAASATPRKNLWAIKAPNVLQAAVHINIPPQSIITEERYFPIGKRTIRYALGKLKIRYPK